MAVLKGRTEDFLNKITYDFIVGMMNRFKGLDLTDEVPEELWMEVCNTV